RYRSRAVSAVTAGNARGSDSRYDRRFVHVPRAARSRGGRVRDEATGPGPGVPRDQAVALSECGLPLPHGTRGLTTTWTLSAYSTSQAIPPIKRRPNGTSSVQ